MGKETLCQNSGDGTLSRNTRKTRQWALRGWEVSIPWPTFSDFSRHIFDQSLFLFFFFNAIAESNKKYFDLQQIWNSLEFASCNSTFNYAVARHAQSFVSFRWNKIMPIYHLEIFPFSNILFYYTKIAIKNNV